MKLHFLFLSAATLVMTACGDGEQSAAPEETAPATEVETDAAPVEEDDSAPADMAMEFTSNIGTGSIGEITVGDDWGDLLNSFGADFVSETEKMSEGEAYNIWQILGEDGQVRFELDVECADGCMVDRITTYDPIYKTKQGIGVESTFNEIKEAHGELSIFMGVPGVMVYPKDMENVAYILETSGLDVDPDHVFEADEILGDTKVVSVYTYSL